MRARKATTHTGKLKTRIQKRGPFETTVESTCVLNLGRGLLSKLRKRVASATGQAESKPAASPGGVGARAEARRQRTHRDEARGEQQPAHVSGGFARARSCQIRTTNINGPA